MHPGLLHNGIVIPGMGILLMLGLTACGPRFDYRHPGETPEGPGMMTGQEGAVTISNDAENSGSDGQAAAEKPECACPEAGELEAYREFLRWKADAVGTPEYREFQDWREWRRQRSK